MSAPPDSARWRGALSMEDIAAQRMSELWPVVWQCEVDLRWQCWADYSVQHTRILEAAWEAMVSQVELETEGSHGECDVWQVCFVSMLQQNQRTGTLRRMRRLLASHS